jgi:tricorn protease
MQKLLFVLMVLQPILNLFGQKEARVLRFPAIHENQLVFSHAGDLYAVHSDGGIARKLTSHIGYEMFPRFSPDGRMIAFTGQYDGNTEVYLIPSEGGIPTRLTYTATLSRDDIGDRMGPNNIVMAWTPDGKYVTYRSRKQSFNPFKGQLFKVPVSGGLSEELPLSTGGFCSWSPDGKKLAYNRVFREFRTWKYYQGGMADDIRIIDLKSGNTEIITDNPAQDIFPMWIGDEVYFLSDRDRRMNLFVYNTKTKNTEKLTHFTEFDIKFPSHSKEYIVFENGGFIYKYDVNQKDYQKVSIYIADDQLHARSEIKDVSKDIRSADLSPNGERIIFTARGEVFSVPSKAGITYNLTQTPGVHERNVSWSPDGKFIAYISDKSGEFEIHVQKQDGSEPARQLTKNADTYIFDFKWSPDSKKMIYHDRLQRLTMVDIATGTTKLVDENKYNMISSYSWSPDSEWIAYSYPTKTAFNFIRLYHLETGDKLDVTDDWFNCSNPVFSADGKYLLFVSARDFNPIYSNTEWNHAYVDMSKIYLVTLASDTPNPLGPENDVVETEKSAPSPDKENDIDKLRIDKEGIQNRIIALPVQASNYFNLHSVNDKVYFTEWKRDARTVAKLFDLKTKKETELGSNLSYVISSNGKKMLVRLNNQYSVIDLPSSKVSITEPVDLSGLKAPVNYEKEWIQIFNESWRQMRDFFYVENMHGVDWPAMKEKYGQLVPYIRHRDDLTYIIGEMIGELNIGHAYINTGEKPKPERISTGLLGAKLSRHSSGFFRVEEILTGANWNPNLRSPLTEIGVDIKEGEFIIEVNGNSLMDINDIYSTLVGLAGKKVELTVNTRPQVEGSRKVIISLIDDESGLYYYNWVQRNIEYVSRKTNGEVGYIHIPDMVTTGLNEFAKYFYPQISRKGLIIDGRGNGGGNVSPMIIERLQRELTRSNVARNRTEGTPVPSRMVLGPKVLLIDLFSASDGDLFPYAFKRHELGTVIGTRSWGGVVGITGSLPFIDGQDLRKPEFASYSADESKWIIEGYGVDPHIWVDNDPHQEYLGNDHQLDKAIEVILEQLKDFKGLPPVPVPPDKSR